MPRGLSKSISLKRNSGCHNVKLMSSSYGMNVFWFWRPRSPRHQMNTNWGFPNLLFQKVRVPPPAVRTLRHTTVTKEEEESAPRFRIVPPSTPADCGGEDLDSRCAAAYAATLDQNAHF